MALHVKNSVVPWTMCGDTKTWGKWQNHEVNIIITISVFVKYFNKYVTDPRTQRRWQWNTATLTFLMIRGASGIFKLGGGGEAVKKWIQLKLFFCKLGLRSAEAATFIILVDTGQWIVPLSNLHIIIILSNLYLIKITLACELEHFRKNLLQILTESIFILLLANFIWEQMLFVNASLARLLNI